MESIDTDSAEANTLKGRLKACVAYYGHTSDKNELTGLSVSIPYGDDSFYNELCDVYRALGIDEEYIKWLADFVQASGYDDYYDFGSFDEDWDGWAPYEAQYGCNICGGGSCEYGYDYGCGGEDDEFNTDWIYDNENDIWYSYEEDVLYLYDEESDILFYYDDYEDSIYYYDDDTEEWYQTE